MVKAGDILILVRRRDPFTTPMIRELKRLNVPVAGADRMKLTDQLAVQDLVALADFLLMPDDDLTLAVVLKSPLFGFDDDDLFKLAYGPRGSLWTALQSKATDDVRFAAAVETLTAWLARADFLPPYEFFSELLGADGQRLRKAMLTRLGPEAAEAIDEFLDIALAYDREAAPSLQGFVNQLRAGDVEIKRDMEQERDQVRIMTVHGAKGLQAPIVFLPDTCMAPRQQGIGLYPLPRAGEPPDEVGHLIWPPRGLSNLAGIEHSKQAVLRAEREEYHRLLYVGMTRAEDRLYIGGWEGLKRQREARLVRPRQGRCRWAFDFARRLRRPTLEPYGIATNRACETSGGRVGAGCAGTPSRLGAHFGPARAAAAEACAVATQSRPGNGTGGVAGPTAARPARS